MKSESMWGSKNNAERGFAALPLIEKDSKKILELGTGDGELMNELRKRGCNVIGLDVFPRKFLLEKGFDIRKHDLNKGLPFKKSLFDAVIGLEVLEHLYNPYEMMKEIKRVLKPNGYAVLSMPNTASLFCRIGQLYEKRTDNLDIYWHHYQPSITSIRNLISKELKIEKEVFISSFRKVRVFNPLLKILIKLNKNTFSGDFMVKARKI
jgi:2-polyprenyl-3-methyl-5-hydroxy-6-metoxy-1,4-benzoquinol methylase